MASSLRITDVNGNPYTIKYYDRDDWDAAPSESRTALKEDNVKGVACHWPATTTKLGTALANYIRGIQRFHMGKERNYSDIAYNTGFDVEGGIWSLRGIDIRSGANGNGQANDDYIAFILFLGKGQPITAKMIRSVQYARTKWVLNTFPNAKQVRTHNGVRKEYTGSGTECPGPSATNAVESGTLTRLYQFINAAPLPTPILPPIVETPKGSPKMFIAGMPGISKAQYLVCDNDKVKIPDSTTFRALIDSGIPNAGDLSATFLNRWPDRIL